MEKKHRRQRRDWRRSIEEHPHQETAAGEMASLIPRRIRSQAYAAASIVGLLQNDIDAESASMQRCPKRPLRKTAAGFVYGAGTIPANSATRSDLCVLSS
jgi:hypothetical protein